MLIACPHCTSKFEAPGVEETPCVSCGKPISDPVLFAVTQGATQPDMPEEILLRPGMRLGRYEVTGKIGQGGMGAVWLGQDVELGRTVAVKTIRADGIGDAETLQRFLREARAAAVLDHPNIVRVHDVGAQGDLRYFVMEHIDGRSLADALDEDTLPPAKAAGIVRDIARALHYAHEKHILHRDVKPPNILMTADGTPKLADFGLTKTIGDGGGLTATTDVIGTPNYMSPEQARATRDADARSDVYSLGAVLYETMTGLPPFRGATPLEVLRQVESAEPVAPSRLRPVPRDLEIICMKALAKEPARRYTTASDFADDLDRFLRGEAIRARPASMALRARRWMRRHPAMAASVTLGVLTAALVGWVLWERHLDRVEQQRREADADRRERERVERELAVSRAVDEAQIPFQAAEMMVDPETRARRRELLEQALGIVESAAARYRDAPELHYRRGQILGALGRADDAVAAYDEALRHDPEFADARYYRLFARHFWRLTLQMTSIPYMTSVEREQVRAEAARLEGVGRPDQVAVAHAMDAMAEMYQFEFLRNGGGDMSEYLDGLHRIEAFAEEAIGANPVNVEARLLRANARLARMLIQRGMTQGQEYPPDEVRAVMGDLDQAARFRPNDMIVRMQRFSSFMVLGPVEAAVEEAEQLVQIAPEDAQAYCARAMVRLREDDAEGGWSDLDRALELADEKGPVHCIRGLAHAGFIEMFSGGGRDMTIPPPEAAQRAREELDLALAAEPPCAVAQLYRALLRLMADGDFIGAREDLEAYIQVEPENPLAYMMAASLGGGNPTGESVDVAGAAQEARAAFGNGDFGSAVYAAAQVVFALGTRETRTPEEQSLLAEMWFLEGAGMSALGRVEECMGALESAVAEGWADWDRLMQEPALRNLRDDPRFDDLLRRWRADEF